MKPSSKSSRAVWLGATVLALAAAGWLSLGGRPALADGETAAVPAPAYNPPNLATSETAVLSGGCFWGLQGVYEHVKGVTKVYAGYSGGAAATASYEVVSTGMTGHAESVNITFNPQVISYGQILQIYFANATDPTELNYQGPDSGTQYRGEIWYATPEQQKIAAAYIAQLSAAHIYSQPIVTRVDPLKAFYNAEGYHQDFLVLHPDYPYIAINDLPKVENLQKDFPQFYRTDPVTVSPAS
jgi:peptide-methionine (S)-S-oxide reductase